jgi:hypothetical protein
MTVVASAFRGTGLVVALFAFIACGLGCAAEGEDGAGIIYHNDFDDDPVGTYSVEQLKAGWRSPEWNDGIAEGRVSIVGAPEADSGHALRVSYPKGSVGPDAGGAQWQLRLDRSYDELYCSYRIKLGSGYDFVRGGKLPGLAGGEANTGGHKPTGKDGWSARMMWREGGKMVQYVYHPDQPTIYGEDLGWTIESPCVFTPGTWQRVEHHVVMNTPGRHDGIVQGWLDGILALDVRTLRFRDVGSFAIDMLYFSTFFGGADPSWAATRDEHVYFDDFVVSTRPITRAADGSRSGEGASQ